MKNRSVLRLFKNFFHVLIGIFKKENYKRVELHTSLNLSIVVLSCIGIFRFFLSIGLGIRFHEGVWFILDPGVFFTMIFFPVFLALFPAMIVDYKFSKWGIKNSTKNVLGLFTSIQVVHIFIPFFEFIQKKFALQCFIPLIPQKYYIPVSISPVATSPLIFLITNACTLGITIAWIISTIAVIRFGFSFKVPTVKFVLLMMSVFYIIYVITYPTYLLFFSHGNNFFYGMIYLLGSIGPYLYFKQRGVE